jgi:thiol:disulfide interchange protein DsbD
MYPILSGIIVGQSPGTGSGTSQAGGKGTGRALLLSAAFVLGIAITYAILGAIAAAAGAKLQAVLQSPVVTVITVLIFVALALSMFGLYELQIPAAWQTRLNAISGRQQSGTYLGAGVMGMLSAAVLSPCVTPPLVGALMYIAQTGNVPRGAGALFALGCGMGIPLLAIGASAGSVLPRAGAWMVGVKNAFGLIMLGMAVWMLDRLVPGSVTLALCAVLAVLAAVLLGAFTPLAAGAGTLPKFAKGTGVLALVYGAALLVGALAGSESPLQPLQFVGRPAGTPQATAEATLFTRVKTVADFERELARAGTEGRPLLLDFYADWCASCKEMEEQTFPDPAVRTELARAIALQADVTAVDADDQALMARFGIVGPPTIVFFSADGREQPSRRIVGFQPAERFAAHLRSTFAAGTEATALAEAR